jgi:hypothetical protein
MTGKILLLLWILAGTIWISHKSLTAPNIQTVASTENDWETVSPPPIPDTIRLRPEDISSVEPSPNTDALTDKEINRLADEEMNRLARAAKDPRGIALGYYCPEICPPWQVKKAASAH